jgi:DNA-binding winged helix-turn-helix (wHTH) protein
MVDSRPDVVRFDDFELDLRAGELRRGGQVVNLPPQQFTVLSVLLEQPGALVSRDHLRTRLWAADEFVDFDAGLNYCIRQLRLALGDTADQPRYIQTMPRRGYRFIAPIRTTAKQPPSVQPRQWWRAAAVALALTIVAGGVLWSIERDPAGLGVPESDIRIADAHAARGFVALNDEWDWEAATRAFQRALQLDPNHEVALISMSRLDASQGRFASALEFAQRARRVHPSSVRALATVGWTQLFAGDFAAAKDTCSAADLSGSPFGRLCVLHAEAAAGTDSLDVWRRLADRIPSEGHGGSMFLRATVAARLGRHDEASDSLAKALDAREPDAMFALVHPALEPLRADPAFRQKTSAAGLFRADLR